MEEQILKQLAQPLLAWYDIHRRILPWREEVSPYRTWVSEIMLQQTRVAAVLPYFQRFMEAFPTVEALAQADTERLMKLWEGLGYYSRARNLQKAARILTEQYGGRFPETYRELTALPGIGDYTAGAILSITFGQAVPAVDGNVLRLAARITGSRLDVLDAKNRKIFRSWMAAAMSQERPGADLTETFQIREYVPGDSMRQIHWKLSGKFDRLIVRDPALPITRNVLVFWERTGQSGSVKRIDAQAETVVSACRSLSDSGVQFTLGWNDTDSNVCVLHEICGMEDLVGVIPRLLCAAGRKDGVGGASLLVQTRPDALCGHMVYIGEEPCADVLQMQRLGHVTALLCGESPLEGSIPFDVGRYREQLGEIDI